jgi:hypothetical protein
MDMKHVIAVVFGVVALSGLDACDDSPSADPVGGTGGQVAGSGGIGASGGAPGTGGAPGSGGAKGTGGFVGSGGRVGTGGQSGGGATSTGGQTGVCPYTVASFSCEAACQKLHTFNARCANDPSVPAELRAMLGLYGEVEVVCTSTCAVVAPASQAQWACFQGVPDDAPCSAIAGCNATNCP